MEKRFWVFSGIDNMVDAVDAEAVYCEHHRGYHAVTRLDGNPIVHEPVFATMHEAEVVAHNAIISTARDEHGFALPFRNNHVDEDENAANN
jgi:hypothetical protein